MATKIIKTVGKLSSSHDRMTLTFKFPNGENLRINCSRYRTSASCKILPGAMKSYAPEDLQKIMKVSHDFVDGENNGQRMERILAVVEKTNSIGEAAKAL